VCVVRVLSYFYVERERERQERERERRENFFKGRKVQKKKNKKIKPS